MLICACASICAFSPQWTLGASPCLAPRPSAALYPQSRMQVHRLPSCHSGSANIAPTSSPQSAMQVQRHPLCCSGAADAAAPIVPSPSCSAPSGSVERCGPTAPPSSCYSCSPSRATPCGRRSAPTVPPSTCSGSPPSSAAPSASGGQTFRSCRYSCSLSSAAACDRRSAPSNPTSSLRGSPPKVPPCYPANTVVHLSWRCASGAFPPRVLDA